MFPAATEADRRRRPGAYVTGRHAAAFTGCAILAITGVPAVAFLRHVAVAGDPPPGDDHGTREVNT
ncbi:hypothetical protein GCM10022224_011360 [Nonomuraea antimicrobica]|uniref:Uncharacterized protein n=1 Tax=Nonomuraea antimicrobica TaxID=561173 RepID=A0ABP7B6F6_9ACTN